MRSYSALASVLIVSGSAAAQVTEVISGRAPLFGNGEVQRAALSVPSSSPFWQLASVRGVPVRSGPLMLAAASKGGPLQIGVNSVPPGGPITPARAGVAVIEGAEVVWRVRVDAPGAGAMRLHLRDVKLPAGAQLLVAGDGRGYAVRAAADTWTPVLDGEHSYVEYRGPAAAGVPGFSIAEVAEIAPPWPRNAGPGRTLPCEVDVQCQTVDAVARDSIALLIFSTGTATFACTGGLLNDANPATTVGWLLTANQAIRTTQAAASVSAYWFFQTPICDGEAPLLSTLPVSQGATLVATSPWTDVTLLRLDQDPSAGQGLAAWTTAEPSGTLWTMHHPLATFKRVANGQATTQPPICFGTRGYYQYHYLDYTLGITEDGSIGAPLFNGQWQVVGQLSGLCVTVPPTCSNPSTWNATFGRFNRSFPLLCNPLTGQISPDRLYVNASATGAGTGLSWTDAYTDLSQALAAACPGPNGLEIWVARGAYKPGPAGGSRESAFALVSGVRVFGGFAGTEASLAERDITANPTILSGDLNGDDGPAFANRADNAYHVVRGTGVDSSAIMDGFVIRGGNANGPTTFNDKGGGLYVEAGSPKVVNCTFSDNAAGFSGGAATIFLGGTADLQACTFAGNTATFGGAVSMTGASGTLAGCIFDSNSATGNGGAIDLYQSSPVFQACTFRSNTTTGRGGAAFMAPSGQPAFDDCRFDLNHAGFGGGAIASSHVDVSLKNCLLVANSATLFGGGILQTDGAHTRFDACRFLGNTCADEGGGLHANSGASDLVNCELSGNRSTGTGGGAIWANHQAAISLLACTVAQNSATGLGGGAIVNDGSLAFTDCILWGNSDSSGLVENAQIRILLGNAALSYSIVQGLTGTLGGTGNLGSDPLFVAPLGLDGIAGTEDDDLSLGESSPAIDAGNSTPVELILTDIRGNARRVDNTCVPDTGAGPAPIVDMGAIEQTGCACYANCDLSTAPPILNINDFLCFLNRFAAESSYANCDLSTSPPVLNVNDFGCFINKFAVGCT